MPLAFSSASHGTVAFGFFNIELDMLLMEQLFFFCDDFCQAVEDLAESVDEKNVPAEVAFQGWHIAAREAIGNLHGAIAGQDLSGFIGATYRRFPFPSQPGQFKQSPAGCENRAVAEQLIPPFGRPQRIPLAWDPRADTVSLEAYRFLVPEFSRLVAYVEQGGYPRWKDEVRPPHVDRMIQRLARLASPLLPESFPRR